MFFESWQELIRISVTSLIIYPLLVVATNLLGKRSVAKMNNFDWIVTVAIGAILGSSILSKSVVITESILAITLLLLLQYFLTFLSARFSIVESLTKKPPTLLFYNGEYLDKALKKQRVSRNEIDATVRKAGIDDLKQVSAVIFESSGELSVIKSSSTIGPLVTDGDTLDD